MHTPSSEGLELEEEEEKEGPDKLPDMPTGVILLLAATMAWLSSSPIASDSVEVDELC